jgi:hypothetical protein
LIERRLRTSENYGIWMIRSVADLFSEQGCLLDWLLTAHEVTNAALSVSRIGTGTHFQIPQ